ncbi:MAG: DnaJ family domain-containing protein [Burkholderiaceae bacterium]
MPLSTSDDLIEEHIRQAHARGDFDNLPGAGKPLDLGEDAHLPAELRMAYRVLKNAGYLPEELQQIKDITQLEAQVYGELDTDAKDRRAALKLRLLQESMRGDSLSLQQYRQQLLAQLSRTDQN